MPVITNVTRSAFSFAKHPFRRKAKQILLNPHSSSANLTFQEAWETYQAVKLTQYRPRDFSEAIRLIEKHAAPLMPNALSDITPTTIARWCPSSPRA